MNFNRSFCAVALAGFVLAWVAMVSPGRAEDNLELMTETKQVDKETDETLLEGIEVQVRAKDSLEERRTTPNAKIVIGKPEIEKYDDLSIGDFLKRLPGVVFGGPPGENKDIRLRGLDKEYTQVLIDGQRVPGAGEKRELQIDRIPASLIERIEIIPNGAATIDSQGVAGTVNIILKNTPDKRVGQFSVGGGWMEEANRPPFALDALYGDRTGKLGWLLSANFQGRTVLKDKNKTKFKSGAFNGAETESEEKEFEEVNLAPRFTWNHSKTDNIEIQPFYFRSMEDKDKAKEIFNNTGALNKTELEDEDVVRATARIRGQWNHIFSPRAKTQLGAAFTRTDENKDMVRREFNAAGSLTKTTLEDEDKVDQVTFVWLHGDFNPFSTHFFKAGVEGQFRDRSKDKIKVENGAFKTEGKDKYQIDENRFNFFIQDAYHWGEHTVITPGFRLEWTDQTIRSNVGAAGNKTFADPNPSIHILHHLTRQDNLRFSAARTLRRPKFDDLVPFVDAKAGTLADPDKVGNADLEPERAIGYEAGWEHFFADKAGVFGLNFFYRDFNGRIENIVVFNPVTGRFEETPTNVDDASLKGVTADLQMRMDIIGFSNLTLNGNVSFFDSEFRDPETGRKVKFKEQPDYIFNVGFDYRIPSWRMNFGGNFNQTGGNNEGAERLEVQRVLDVYLNKQLAERWFLRLSGKNLLEADKEKTKLKFDASGNITDVELEEETSSLFLFATLEYRF